MSPEGIEPSTYRLRVPRAASAGCRPLILLRKTLNLGSTQCRPSIRVRVRWGQNWGQDVEGLTCGRALVGPSAPSTVRTRSLFSLSAGLVAAPSVHRSTWPTVTT